MVHEIVQTERRIREQFRARLRLADSAKKMENNHKNAVSRSVAQNKVA